MFGLFGNKKKKAKTSSRIGMTRNTAFNELVTELSQQSGSRYVFYFFEESRLHLKHQLEKENISIHGTSGSSEGVYLLNARKQNLTVLPLSAISKVYCIDHFPLYSVFEAFAASLYEANPSQTLIVYGGLDEPIFNVFGGNRIKDLMVKMGMQETEMIEHSMISKAIENAQEKIEKKVVLETSAQSSAEWFKQNLPQVL
ncbi:MAG: hypothetical protein H0W61_00500 [Bacteroidetes bacterium]|nr:hypothetical protein [Bacteroidota bacterium]